jgi:long-chain fatty acid transport protein
MRRTMIYWTRLLLQLFSFIFLCLSFVNASNGIKMISCNYRSAGMGGAHVALPADGSGAACNPASLGKLRERSATFGFSLLIPRIEMENGIFGPNQLKSESERFPLFFGGWAHSFGPDSPWTFGFALSAQGGLGVEFADVRTFAGTSDSFSSELPFLRMSPAVSYRVNDRFSIGFAGMIGYARMDASLFPGTYSPGPDATPGSPDDFPGMEVEGLSGSGFAVRLGAQYDVNDTVSLGVSYSSKSAIELGGGDLDLNFGPAGQIGYEATLPDFNWPQEFEFGVALNLNSKSTVAADIKWIGWSGAIETLVLKGKRPDPPFPVTDPEIPFRMDWENQWVAALGFEHRLTTEHCLRAGYNYGASPVPDAYVSPAFPASVEHHLTLGYGLNMGRWGLDAAWEHSFKKDQYNSNTNLSENPFGPDLRVSMLPGNVFHIGLTFEY